MPFDLPFDLQNNLIILYNLCCQNVSIGTTLYLLINFVHFKVILTINSSYLLYVITENKIIRNEFNNYLSYTSIT